ncbi:MAG: sulfur-carrier protein [Mycobacterium sp.]|jgi:molybdopterin converting factor small subunit|nr:sulfur-carrier protein [Mycobacterium sp.]
MTPALRQLSVTVRYFGAARAAANSEVETVAVQPGSTVADLANQLGDSNPRLAAVLVRCSYLRDGVAVREPAVPLQSGQTIDVLPPFAGG